MVSIGHFYGLLINRKLMTVVCDHCKNHSTTKVIEYDIKVPLQVRIKLLIIQDDIVSHHNNMMIDVRAEDGLDMSIHYNNKAFVRARPSGMGLLKLYFVLSTVMCGLHLSLNTHNSI